MLWLLAPLYFEDPRTPKEFTGFGKNLSGNNQSSHKTVALGKNIDAVSKNGVKQAMDEEDL